MTLRDPDVWRESEADAEYHGVGKYDRPAPVHLDLTPGTDVTRACGSPEGSSSAFAFADDVTCAACLDALGDLAARDVRADRGMSRGKERGHSCC